ISNVIGRRLRLIGTNDVHGALEPRPDANGVMRGGLAYLAAAIERAERECAAPECTALLLDGGDEFQGTPASNFAFGRPIVDVFNRLGLAAAALGNHEFDWGQDTLRADGAAVIVVVAHAGAFCDRTGQSGCTGEIVDLAKHLTQHVDAIVSGHTHTLVNSVVNGVPILQGRSSGQAIDVIDIPIGPNASGMPAHEVRDVLPDSFTADPGIQAIVASATQAVAARVSRPIARI